MKNLFKLTAALLLVLNFGLSTINAQTPQSFKYQAVVRDGAGNVLANQMVGFQLSILQTSETGTAVYTETFNKTTNFYGLVNLNIGEGTPVSGNFSTINWGADAYFLKVELDETGGTSYTHIGTSKLNSVPYALHANTADNTFSGDYDSLYNKPVLTGDVTGDIQANTVEKIQGLDISVNTPGSGQVLKWNGTEWAPADDNVTGGSGVDGVVDGASFSGTTNKTLTLSRSNGLTPLSANFTDEVDDADNDATNELITGATLNGTDLEITDAGGTSTVDLSSLDNTGTDSQTLSVSGTSLTISNGNTVILQDNVDDADNDIYNELQILNFSNDTLYLSDGGQIYMGAYGNLWEAHGDDIYNKNTRNVGVGLEDPMGKLVVQGDSAVSDTLPLFEVKNKDGQTVFAVYDGGVRVYVNDDPAKANNDKSGFAIGGYRLDKTITNEYLRVTPDSVRVYIKEENTNKDNNKKGGFAIGGYRLDKTLPEEYFNIYAADTAYTVDTTARILWYPLKEAFLSGKVLIENQNDVGQNSWATGYISKATGDYSQAMGYKAKAIGDNSTAIGDSAKAEGYNSYAFGNNAYTSGANTYAIGNEAIASGDYSFAIGSKGVDFYGTPTTGAIASGNLSYAFGMGAKAENTGSFAIGVKSKSSGTYSLALGYGDQATGTYATAIGIVSIASGWSSVAIGENARASGSYCAAIGLNVKASGNQSIALGYNTVASGTGSFATGYQTNSVGIISTSMGFGATARGGYSTAIGSNIIAKSQNEFVIGYFNDTTASTSETSLIDSDPLFIIGNGIDHTNRHNALTVLKNGNVGIGTNSAIYNLHVLGSDTLASVLVAPNRSDYNANSELILAEDDDYTYGMSIYYDGLANQMQFRGKADATTYGPWLTIDRGNGAITMPGVYDDAVGVTNKALYIDDSGLIGFLSSSRRYKKQIKDMENTDWFYKLRPVNYLYKTDKKGIKQYGLIAEEVEEVNKLFVSYNKDGVIETVNYNQFISPMIKVIQEQKKEIDKLKTENFANKTISKQNKSEIENLKAEIEQLKQILEVKAQK